MTFASYVTKVEEFKGTIQQITSILEATPEEILYIQPSETEWSGMQITSHILEAVTFWVADLEALLIVPGAKWGRNHEHVRRLAAVEPSVVNQIKKVDAIAALNALVPLVENTLNKVQEEDLTKTAPSYNVNFDGKPLSFLIDHLIIKHVVGHLGQIERHLAKVQ